jgi:hypothetical protein
MRINVDACVEVAVAFLYSGVSFIHMETGLLNYKAMGQINL